MDNYLPTTAFPRLFRTIQTPPRSTSFRKFLGNFSKKSRKKSIKLKKSRKKSTNYESKMTKIRMKLWKKQGKKVPKTGKNTIPENTEKGGKWGLRQKHTFSIFFKLYVPLSVESICLHTRRCFIEDLLILHLISYIYSFFIN